MEDLISPRSPPASPEYSPDRPGPFLSPSEQIARDADRFWHAIMKHFEDTPSIPVKMAQVLNEYFDGFITAMALWVWVYTVLYQQGAMSLYEDMLKWIPVSPAWQDMIEEEIENCTRENDENRFDELCEAVGLPSNEQWHSIWIERAKVRIQILKDDIFRLKSEAALTENEEEAALMENEEDFIFTPLPKKSKTWKPKTIRLQPPGPNFPISNVRNEGKGREEEEVLSPPRTEFRVKHGVRPPAVEIEFTSERKLAELAYLQQIVTRVIDRRIEEDAARTQRAGDVGMAGAGANDQHYNINHAQRYNINNAQHHNVNTAQHYGVNNAQPRYANNVQRGDVFISD